MIEKKDTEMTLKEAACMNKVRVHAYYSAIKKGHLKAFKRKQRWFVKHSEVEHYKGNKFNKDKAYWNGEKVYREGYMEISPAKAAKLCGVPISNIYHFIKTGQLPAFKKGTFWVLNYDITVQFFREKYDNPKQMRFA